mgnify:CR=1 FL=1
MTPAEFFRFHGACEEACDWLENFVNIEGAWRNCTDAEWMAWALECLNVPLTSDIELESFRVVYRSREFARSHNCSHMSVWRHGYLFCCSAAINIAIQRSSAVADVIRQHIPVETVIKAYVEAGGK